VGDEFIPSIMIILCVNIDTFFLIFLFNFSERRDTKREAGFNKKIQGQ
jgi:hypothetical protein